MESYLQSYISASVNHFIMEEKLVALLVCSSFKQVATIGLRRNSEIPWPLSSSVNQSHSNSAQFKNEYGVTPYSVPHRAIAD